MFSRMKHKFPGPLVRLGLCFAVFSTLELTDESSAMTDSNSINSCILLIHNYYRIFEPVGHGDLIQYFCSLPIIELFDARVKAQLFNFFLDKKVLERFCAGI